MIWDIADCPWCLGLVFWAQVFTRRVKEEMDLPLRLQLSCGLISVPFTVKPSPRVNVQGNFYNWAPLNLLSVDQLIRDVVKKRIFYGHKCTWNCSYDAYLRGSPAPGRPELRSAAPHTLKQAQMIIIYLKTITPLQFRSCRHCCHFPNTLDSCKFSPLSCTSPGIPWSQTCSL